ncbi:hypothetical protein [Streptomyces sp. NPDC055607]
MTFTGGPTITVYGPELHSPGLPSSGGPDYEEFIGYMDHDRPGIPWPTASARIEQSGQALYEVTDAHVDISNYGGRMDFLRLTWPTVQRRALPPATETTEAEA